MLRLLRSTDYGALLDLVSPKFFDVLPSSALKSEIGALAGALRNKKQFHRRLDDRRAELASLGIDLVDRVEASPVTNVESYGQTVLELYFWQLFARDTTLLDLRSSRLAQTDERVCWQPSRIFSTWRSDFIDPIRSLYRAFYAGDDAAFDQALAELNLGSARQLFIEHFGGDQQRDVRFEIDRFQSVFHQVFLEMRDSGTHLHPNFISFGIYLGTLYENLSRFDQGFDVRAAFERVEPEASSQESRLHEHATQAVQ